MERQAEAGRRYRVQSSRIWWHSFTRYHRRHSSFQRQGDSLLRRIPSSPCRHRRHTARLNASALSRAVPRRSGHQVRKACIRGQLQRKEDNRVTLRRASAISRLQRNTMPSGQSQRPQSPNRCQPKRHQPDQDTDRRLRRRSRSILHAQHPRQRRAQRPQPPQRRQPALPRPRPNRNRPHGRRQPHQAQNHHRPA